MRQAGCAQAAVHIITHQLPLLLPPPAPLLPLPPERRWVPRLLLLLLRWAAVV
jgi:hypothetical protein